MDFYMFLDQVVHLLRQRQRVTYRALQRQWQLEEEILNDLKAELLYAYPQIHDDAGRGLVWTDEAGATSEPVLPVPQATLQASAQAEPPIQGSSLAVESQSPEAERRQLMVLFCDLVASTALASQLDPEDLREVVRAYQATCAEVIQRFDGHIAQYLGDSLLVYFGYPQAHEDDAQRAVHTGLGIVEALRTLNLRLKREQGLRLAVRISIHRGVVVAGEVGSGRHQEQLALGDTPNLAARLQECAVPDTVVISAATWEHSVILTSHR